MKYDVDQSFVTLLSAKKKNTIETIQLPQGWREILGNAKIKKVLFMNCQPLREGGSHVSRNQVITGQIGIEILVKVNSSD